MFTLLLPVVNTITITCYNTNSPSKAVFYLHGKHSNFNKVLFLVDITGCGGYLTEDEGIIISPNWPNPYDENQVT